MLLQELLSLVFKDVGMTKLFSYESKSGSAQSSSLRRRPGINEIKANCIMQRLSHLEPKNNICLCQVLFLI